MRKENYFICSICGKIINKGAKYFTAFDEYICEECSEELLIYDEAFENYVYQDEHRETYSDDSMSDITVFYEDYVE